MYMNFNVSTLAGIPAAVVFFYLSNRYEQHIKPFIQTLT